jgi:hypothetical protein
VAALCSSIRSFPLGAVAKSEIDDRLALGSNAFFVPPGLNEEAVKAAGLAMLRRQDRAGAVADIGARWHAVRLRHAAVLKREEGKEWFERRQRMLATSAELLSRFLYVAEEPLLRPGDSRAWRGVNETSSLRV